MITLPNNTMSKGERERECQKETSIGRLCGSRFFVEEGIHLPVCVCILIPCFSAEYKILRLNKTACNSRRENNARK